MREAAEARDDVVMALRPLREAGERGLVALELREQPQRLALHREVLGVLERQVDELALHAGEPAVATAGHQRARRRERASVARERARGAAKDVARELVEHDDLRQRADWHRGPVFELAREGALDQRTEASAALGVERRILDEPLVARRAVQRIVGRAEPEVEHRSCLRVDHAAATRSCRSGWRRRYVRT